MRRTYLEARDLLEATGDESTRANIARDRQLVQLRAAAPMRSRSRAVHDVDGLGLFDHARQPSLF